METKRPNPVILYFAIALTLICLSVNLARALLYAARGDWVYLGIIVFYALLAFLVLRPAWRIWRHSQKVRRT